MTKLLFRLIRNTMVRRMKTIGMTWAQINKVLDCADQRHVAIASTHEGMTRIIFEKPAARYWRPDLLKTKRPKNAASLLLLMLVCLSSCLHAGPDYITNCTVSDKEYTPEVNWQSPLIVGKGVMSMQYHHMPAGYNVSLTCLKERLSFETDNHKLYTSAKVGDTVSVLYHALYDGNDEIQDYELVAAIKR